MKAHRAFRNGGNTYYLSEGGQAMVSEEECHDTGTGRGYLEPPYQPDSGGGGEKD